MTLPKVGPSVFRLELLMGPEPAKLGLWSTRLKMRQDPVWYLQYAVYCGAARGAAGVLMIDRRDWHRPRPAERSFRSVTEGAMDLQCGACCHTRLGPTNGVGTGACVALCGVHRAHGWGAACARKAGPLGQGAGLGRSFFFFGGGKKGQGLAGPAYGVP